MNVLPIILDEFSLSTLSKYLVLSLSLYLGKLHPCLKCGNEAHVLCRVVYPWKYIKKCCSCSMQFSLHTRHVCSSTGIYAPLFSYFPVCIRNAWHPNLNLVRLILFAGFLSIDCQVIFKLIIPFNFPMCKFFS